MCVLTMPNKINLRPYVSLNIPQHPAGAPNSQHKKQKVIARPPLPSLRSGQLRPNSVLHLLPIVLTTTQLIVMYKLSPSGLQIEVFYPHLCLLQLIFKGQPFGSISSIDRHNNHPFRCTTLGNNTDWYRSKSEGGTGADMVSVVSKCQICILNV